MDGVNYILELSGIALKEANLRVTQLAELTQQQTAEIEALRDQITEAAKK